MGRKVITCPGCELTRSVSDSRYYAVMQGKSAYCPECVVRKRPGKQYFVTCPFCSKERETTQSVYYHVNSGKRKGLCEECTEIYRKENSREEIMTLEYTINEPYLKEFKEQRSLNSYLYQSSHRDKRKESWRRYYDNNIDYVRFLKRVNELKRRARSFISKEIIEQILKEHGTNGMVFCYICKNECSDDYHMDHVIPLIKGGKNNKENLKPACSSCNLSKGSKDLEEFLERNPYLKNLKEA